MANRTFHLGLRSGQSASILVYKHASNPYASLGSLTQLLSGNTLTTTFQSVTVDESHYLYFVTGTTILSVFGPGNTGSTSSGQQVSSGFESDGNYVFDTQYRGVHLDAGNPSGGGSSTDIAPAYTFNLTTDAANSEQAVVRALYVRHPTGSSDMTSTVSATATAASATTVTLPASRTVGGETHYFSWFKVYNGNNDAGESQY